MAGKELKRMSRRELVELIYEMKKRELDLRSKLDQAQAELDDRAIKISASGSIAEAAVSLSGVFEAAQTAADSYLFSLQAIHGQRDEILAKAREESDQILQGAELEALARIQRADAEIARKWAEFREKTSKNQE